MTRKALTFGYFVCFTAGNGGNEKCSDEQFQCGNATGKCIPKRWQCDYHKDCENGEDEYDCRKYTLLINISLVFLLRPGGSKTSVDFWPKINIPEGDYYILEIESIIIRQFVYMILLDSIFNVKNQHIFFLL